MNYSNHIHLISILDFILKKILFQVIRERGGENLNFISRELEVYFGAFIPTPETLVWGIKFYFL